MTYLTKYILPLLVVFLFAISCNDSEQNDLLKKKVVIAFSDDIISIEDGNVDLSQCRKHITGKMDSTTGVFTVYVHSNYCYWDGEEKEYKHDTSDHSRFNRYDVDSPYTVTAIDKEGVVRTFIGATNPPEIPYVDTSIYTIVKISK